MLVFCKLEKYKDDADKYRNLKLLLFGNDVGLFWNIK